MSAPNTVNWIRVGILALPIYGLLTFWGTFTHEPNRDANFEAYARYISSTSYLVQHLLASILGAILAIFGVTALGAYLANSRVGRSALLAMVMSVAGNALLLTFFGVSTIVSPVIGQLYLAGQQGTVGVNEAIFSSALVPLISGPGLLLYLVGTILFVVGTILFGVAVWRSSTLPKWAGALYAPSGSYIFAGQFVGASQTPGTLLLIVASGWIAWSVLQQPSAEAVEVGAHPRVQ